MLLETLSNPIFWAAAVAVGVVLYMVVESQWLEVTETTLTFDNLPPAFDGFRIVMVSDFHATGLGRFERRVVERLRRIDADLLVVPGDIKARNTTRNERLLPLVDALVEATARYPFRMVYTRGNHDRRGFSALMNRRRDLFALRDESIALQRGEDRIVIAGTRRSARVTRRMRPALRKALRGVAPDEFVIFVSHSPDFLRMAARRGVDLVLSGDTHGGQIRLPLAGTIGSKSRLGRDCDIGHAKKFGAQLYVTRGVGHTGPPLRLLCRPEIAVLTLRRASRG